MKLEDHPTVRNVSRRGREVAGGEQARTILEGAWLRRLALDCGADDVGLVEIARPGLDPQCDEILRNYPWTKSLLSGSVTMAVEDALTKHGKAERCILACQAKIRGDVGVDA